MTTKTLITLLGGISLLLAGCDVKDPIYDTAHPEHGKITITTDWSKIGEGLTAPESYQIKVGDYMTTANSATHTLDHLFAPQDYHAYIYSTADNIAVNGTTASVAIVGPSGGLGAAIHNTPQWFFACATNLTIGKDKDYEFTATMQQQVRQLTLVIEPTGNSAQRIESISAKLSGVAGTLDIDNGTYGSPSVVSLPFSKGADGKWSATVRLLGTTDMPTLDGTISFTSGNPEPILFDSDLTASLSTFNNDKRTPLTLNGPVVITPDGADFTATITGWEIVEKDEVTAN